jgi:hypothetical protein
MQLRQLVQLSHQVRRSGCGRSGLLLLHSCDLLLLVRLLLRHLVHLRLLRLLVIYLLLGVVLLRILLLLVVVDSAGCPGDNCRGGCGTY